MRAVKGKLGRSLYKRGIKNRKALVGHAQWETNRLPGSALPAILGSGEVNQAMTMSYQHASLAAGGWQTLPLAEPPANVASDVVRARCWQEKDPQ